MHHKYKIATKRLGCLCLMVSTITLAACSSGGSGGDAGYDSYALGNIDGVVSLINFTRTSNPFGLDPTPAPKKVAITGLATGEVMRGLDFHPTSLELIGISNKGKIYKIDTETGAATLLVTLNKGGTAKEPYFASDLADTYEIDIDPKSLRLWVTSSVGVTTAGTTFSADISSGEVVASPALNGYIPTSSDRGTRALAFTSNAPNACQPKLWGLSTGFTSAYYSTNPLGAPALLTDRLFAQDTSTGGLAGNGSTVDVLGQSMQLILTSTTIPNPNSPEDIADGRATLNSVGSTVYSTNTSGTAYKNLAETYGMDILTDVNGADTGYAVLLFSGAKAFYSIDFSSRRITYIDAAVQSITGGVAIRPDVNARASGC